MVIWYNTKSLMSSQRATATDHEYGYLKSHDHTNYTGNNFEMNNIWRNLFLSLKKPPFLRIYISDKCHFIYFTTLKTGSFTTRKLIDIKQCGFGSIFHKPPKHRTNTKYWKTCGDHNCGTLDYAKILSQNK